MRRPSISPHIPARRKLFQARLPLSDDRDHESLERPRDRGSLMITIITEGSEPESLRRPKSFQWIP